MAAFRIGVMAPGGALVPEVEPAVQALAGQLYGDAVKLVFHPQCFERSGHFAGSDARRAEAFLEIANDPAYDALWFGRGGYGSNRIVEAVCARLAPAAADKAYLGYSDAGTFLSALYRRGFGKVFHGPMPGDIRLAGGEAAVARGLAWLVDRDPAALEPSVGPEGPTAAFNLIILAHLIGTPAEPDLAGHVVMLEEVGEYMYRIDRDLCQVTEAPGMRRIAGLRMGRCGGVPENDPDFVLTEAEVARFWCERAGIPYLGRADIGHDVANKVVPFGNPPP
jgi:muramoyltetrapeptide carboxypeptidase